jgi:NAD-dependent SIR2 family protein deacetylase
MNKCKCGADGLTEPVIECSVTRWRAYCHECGQQTETWMLKESAEAEWNRLNPNFPKCGECENFQDPGLCIMHDTGTEEKWTCPDYMPKDDIEVYTHEHNKNLLDTHIEIVEA